MKLAKGITLKLPLLLPIMFSLMLQLTLGTSAQAWDAGKFHKPTSAELKKKLSAEQFHVTQEEGTERAFTGATYDNHEPGIYVDIVSGEPLFTSNEKFDSGTGWPSFWQPINKDAVKTKTDKSFMSERTEVRSKLADSHLGHLFDDGPQPTGLRYCMNSAAMRFIPVAKLEAEGYGEYSKLFEKKPDAPKSDKTKKPEIKK